MTRPGANTATPTVTGTSDAILHLVTRDMRHLEAVLERIRVRAAIERSESIVVLSNIVERRVGGWSQA